MTLERAQKAQARRVSRYELMKRALIMFTAVLVTAVFGILLSQQQRDGETIRAVRETQLTNHAVLNAVLDCTRAGGRCYADGQKRTEGAVGAINEEGVARAACTVILLSRLTAEESPVRASRRIAQCVTDTVTALHKHH